MAAYRPSKDIVRSLSRGDPGEIYKNCPLHAAENLPEVRELSTLRIQVYVYLFVCITNSFVFVLLFEETSRKIRLCSRETEIEIRGVSDVETKDRGGLFYLRLAGETGREKRGISLTFTH